MADPSLRSGGERTHLDALGPREVVYCHQCDNEWYNDEHGLTCPRCRGEITEIVTPESDPRPMNNANVPTPNYNTRPDPFRNPNHNPWDDSDPEEEDIEEHITHGPGGSILISRTIRPSGLRNQQNRPPPAHGDPNETVRNFQQMLGTLMGPGFRPGQPGTSSRDTLFNHGPFGGGHRAGGGDPHGPRIIGGRFTYTTSGNVQPRGGASGDIHPAPVDDLATFISSIFGPQPPPEGQAGMGGMPLGFQGILATLLNPANARSGDAVYTQEALDRIISNLMEQQTSSNAPGPASADAIAALPKKKLDEKMLGSEGTGECSVCMDDVFIGAEVVVLPCTHWFHQECAGAWLKEHNTCPICRKGIEGETPSSSSRRENQNASSSPRPTFEERNQRLSDSRSSNARPGLRGEEQESTTARNQGRLDAIRNTAGLGSMAQSSGPTRWQAVGHSEGLGSSVDGSGANRNDDPGNNSSHSRPLPHRRRSSNILNGNAGLRDYIQRGSRSGESGDNSRATAGGAGGSSSSGQGIASWVRDRWFANSGNRRRE